MLSYQNCTLCPRRCGADRTNGQLGFCRQPDKIYAARAAAHYWEEPVISGSFGSGAVFFSGCTLKCLFCQNGVISQENLGKEISTAHLKTHRRRCPEHQSRHADALSSVHSPGADSEAPRARGLQLRRL